MSGADDRTGQAAERGAGEAVGWMPEIEEIRRRREFAQTMGGPEKVKRQLASGRLTVRDRIARLTDPGTGQCGTTYPVASNPRLVAGEPLTMPALKCSLKPLNFGDYPVTFTTARLHASEGIVR